MFVFHFNERHKQIIGLHWNTAIFLNIPVIQNIYKICGFSFHWSRSLNKYVQTTNTFGIYFNPASPQLVYVVQLEGTLHLSVILDFCVHVRLNDQLHFMARGGDRDFVDLCKALTDVHKCFIFGFREDDEKVDRSQGADRHKHQEGKGLELLLHKQKTHRQELGRSNSFVSRESLHFLKEPC